MSRHKKWFIKVRGSYLPNSWQGWLTYIPYVGYLAAVFAYAMVQNDDIWQATFLIVPNCVAALAVMTWLARLKS